MAAKKRSSKQAWRDPDDAPSLDRAWFEEADVMIDRKVVRRGRPAGTAKKQAISIRLDHDVLVHFREAGPGWQAKINATLRRSMAGSKLVAKPQAFTGAKNRSGLTREALKVLSERESAGRLAQLGGTEPKVKAAPRR